MLKRYCQKTLKICFMMHIVGLHVCLYKFILFYIQ